ncbi:MAG: hypothetical protein AAGK79_09635 [Pseudomonadota bacterium]
MLWTPFVRESQHEKLTALRDLLIKRVSALVHSNRKQATGQT